MAAWPPSFKMAVKGDGCNLSLHGRVLRLLRVRVSTQLAVSMARSLLHLRIHVAVLIVLFVPGRAVLVPRRVRVRGYAC